MTTPVQCSHHLDQLTRPKPRLPGLLSWVLNEVGSDAAFEVPAGRSPQAYLLNGERWMSALETLMIAAGDRLYAELAELPLERFGVGRFMSENPNPAVVMFDGCSLREIPHLTQLARDSGREVRRVRYARWSLSQPAEGAFSVPLGVSSWWIDTDGGADAVGGAGADAPAYRTTPRLRNERHGDNMKRKVRIDDDLMAELKSRARIEQMSVTHTLNRVIRTCLAASHRPYEERERCEEATVQMGRPRGRDRQGTGSCNRSRV